ncbi:helix-turn-helix domain-containing protein [Yokenella regensburgei]|uniref:helix-turn-helix domain-containing protein n=1 Tax=Yokenella regensburgei TaxID=158877 RepID=UPI001376199D|nr:helix-turn-helix transcriptional regulator [Yokenella regensburgei]KAF1366802.1 transcriptional regulator with XRE-family HTH domain [Yokenella regensburgei]
MTGFELKLWRRGQQWTQQQAADQFGISLATYKRYEKGKPPRVIEMAIKTLELGDMLPTLHSLKKEIVLRRLQALVWEKVKVSSELSGGIK